MRPGDSAMSFVEAIIRKRDGGRRPRRARELPSAPVSGDLPPEQLAAMLMAICIRGMDPDETRLADRGDDPLR